MKKEKHIVFEDFKADFYRKVKDFRLFDFGEHNAIKIVLDGLKVDYISRFKSRSFMFYPKFLLKLVFFLNRKRLESDATFNEEKLSKVPILLFDYSGRFVETEDGKTVSFYFENIIRKLGHDNTCHIVFKSKSQGVKYDIECDKFFHLRYAKLTARAFELRAQLLKLYKNIKYSGIFSADELKNIKIAISAFFENVKYWNKVLDKFGGLKHAIIEMHYHNEALIYCLRQRGIPVTEIQHGLISVKDIFYVFPNEINNIKHKALFPDKILVLGQYWKEVLLKGSEYSDKPGNIVVLGDFFFKGASIPGAQKEELDTFKGDNELILVCTQTFMQDDYIPYITWLSDDLLKNKLPYKIIVKLHPSENPDTYASLTELPNVLVGTHNLSYLFTISAIHISIYSTTLFDALQFNIHNFSLASTYAEDYRQEILMDKVAKPLARNQNPVFLINNNEKTSNRMNAGYFYDDYAKNSEQLMELVIPREKITECVKCILGVADDPQITFDGAGVCNHCRQFQDSYTALMNMSPVQKEKELQAWVRNIKEAGKGKKYDVVCGISGGVDSSYLAIMAKELGLRTLLVHFDNGWNSELAVKNIEQICTFTGFDLYTYVVDWEEFKDLQNAYIKAGVLDWEVPTDHGLWAVILKKSKELNVKYVLIGANYQTEGVLPKAMRYDKADLKNIKDIYRKFGKGKKFRSFPTYPFWWHQYLKWAWGLKLAPLLYYVDYDKARSKQYLVDTVGWRDYGGKHYESIFTRFYQGYVLKHKFGFDKRKAHLASLINSRQITREQALAELAKPIMDEEVLKDDTQFFLKKMGLSEEEFNHIMKAKPVQHEHFKTYSSFEYPLMKRILKVLVILKRIMKGNAKK